MNEVQAHWKNTPPDDFIKDIEFKWDQGEFLIKQIRSLLVHGQDEGSDPDSTSDPDPVDTVRPSSPTHFQVGRSSSYSKLKFSGGMGAV